MLHTPYFLLSRPMTFFGTYLQFEQEMDEEFDRDSENWEFISDTKHPKPSDQTIGLFIHWGKS